MDDAKLEEFIRREAEGARNLYASRIQAWEDAGKVFGVGQYPRTWRTRLRDWYERSGPHFHFGRCRM